MAASHDKAFEIFVKRAVTAIQKEAWGRSRESTVLRDSCQTFLNLLEAHEQGTSNYDGSLALAVLQPLQLACSSSSTKIVELALGCLHKLVAHAWLQGESSVSEGLLDDSDDIVAQVIKLVIKCGETANDALQLAVVRALLTFATAEHFIAHGDSLMSAVRTVFNLALGSEDDTIKRTAGNALLQMLNTICKRVTAYQLHSVASSVASASRRVSETGSVSGSQEASAAGRPPRGPSLARTNSLQRHSMHHEQHIAAIASSAAQAASSPGGMGLGELARTTSGASSIGSHEPASDARTAQFASLAEQRDIRGLEAAIGAGSADADISTSPVIASAPTARLSLSSAPSSASASASIGGVGSPQENGSTMAHGGSSGGGGGVLPMGGPTPAAIAAAADKHASRAQLTILERDVLLVLTAFCKLASREAGLTEVESYLHQGKLLALELLVKVLQNPQHSWGCVRDEFVRNLRQPLCITLLRNCTASDTAAFQLAIKLLVAVMLQPKLRRGLKAELGAFYPLFVLRPLEQEPGDLHTLYVVLTSVRQLCGDAQLMVDLFVNYDCDLQAPNLFERTVTALNIMAHKSDADQERPQQSQKQQELVARVAAIRDVALRSVVSVVACLDTWATPIKESHARLGATPDHTAVAAGSGPEAAAAAAATADSNGTSSGGMAPSSNGGAAPAASVPDRFEAAKTQKSSLSKGIAMFNAHPMKGVRHLIAQGLVDKAPAAVAAFLAQHASELDKMALGELFGHHEEFEVAIMHAWVDLQRYTGLSIDMALRRLLEQFRLPGEAQKIDRIMEKFAERFCKDNPGTFQTADAAYMLSFAIIMLNTDAHNPMAERRLGKADFVAMNYVPGSGESEEAGQGGEAALVPALPVEELEGIYDRVTTQEIKFCDDSQSASAAHMDTNKASRTRLAAALGWRVLSLPFKPLARNWGKATLSDAERKRQVIQLAERAVARGAGSLWHTSTHAEHARPMLTVTGGPILEALSYSLAAASDLARAQAVLPSLITMLELAGLLGLEELCERCVGTLAAAAGMATPAAYGSFEEQKQLLVLKALLALPAGPSAALLGSAWPTILRTCSMLDALIADLSRPGPQAQATVQQQQGGGGGGACAASGGVGTDADSGYSGSGGYDGSSGSFGANSMASAMANPFNKMFQVLGISLGGGLSGGKPPGADGGAAPMIMVSRLDSAEPLLLRMAAGASLATWALTDGQEAIDQVYAHTVHLDGEAVVVFFRALCAVSREELDAPTPRVYSLQKLVDCANHNANRIRLIWRKLWAIISAHLVMASCQTQQSLALYAVQSLQQLLQRLLARAELAHYTQQEEALRPFVVVLRLCDDARVREHAVQVVGEAVSSHRRVLGSGWRTVLEVLRRAAADSAQPVLVQGTQALQLVVDALYMGPQAAGHDYFRETVKAVEMVINNPTDSSVSIRGVQLLLTCGLRLAEQGSSRHATSSSSSGSGGSSSSDDAGAGPSPAGAARGQGAAAEGGAGTLSGRPSQSAEDQGSQSLSHSTSTGAASLGDGWALLLGILATTLSQDQRAGVVDAATQATLELMTQHGACWSEAAWQVLLRRVLPSLFQQSSSSSMAAPAGAGAAPTISSELLLRINTYFPHLCNQLPVMAPAYKEELLQQLATISLQWFQQPSEPLAMSGLHGLEKLAMQLAADTSSSSSWDLLLGLLGNTLLQELEAVMALTQQLQLQQLSAASSAAQAAAGLRPGGAAGSTRGSSIDSRSVNGRSSTDSSRGSGAAAKQATAAAQQGLQGQRRRARMLLMLQRLLSQLQLQQLKAQPWRVHYKLLNMLLFSTRRAMDFNLQLHHTSQQHYANLQLKLSDCGPSKSSNASFHAPQQQQQQQQQPTSHLAPQPINAKPAAVAVAVSGRPQQQGGLPLDEEAADGILEAESLSAAGFESALEFELVAGSSQLESATTQPNSTATVQQQQQQADSVPSSAEGTTGRGSLVIDPSEPAQGRDGAQQQPEAASTVSASVPAAAAGVAELLLDIDSLQLQSQPTMDGGPDALLSTSDCCAVLAPNLARLECEAAMLAMAGLQHCIALGIGPSSTQSSAVTSDTTSSDMAEGAVLELRTGPQQLLNEFCITLINSGTRWHPPATAPPPPPAPAATANANHAHGSNATRHATASSTTSRSSATAANQESLPAAHPPWYICVRAPVLAHAIYTYLDLPHIKQPQQLQSMLPTMLALIRHSEPVVRYAVADFLQQTLAPLLKDYKHA